jgi:hypothetical protein
MIFLGICPFLRMLMVGIVAIALVKTPYVVVKASTVPLVAILHLCWNGIKPGSTVCFIEGVSRSFHSSRVQFLHVTFGSDINYNNGCKKLSLHVCSVTFLYFTSQANIILHATEITVVFECSVNALDIIFMVYSSAR